MDRKDREKIRNQNNLEYLQMAYFVRSDDDTAESTSILDDSDRIHFFETLIYDARSANIGESCMQKRSFNTFQHFALLQCMSRIELIRYN